MTDLSLNGPAWRLARANAHTPDPGELERLAPWYPAEVPGDVRLDLQRAGELPADLYYGTNSLRSAWVEDRDWWYTRDFALALDPRQRAHLTLSGVDYVSRVFLNGTLLGRHEGMFSPQTYELTGRLVQENRLAVHIRGAARLPRRADRRETLLDRVEALMNNAVTARNARRQVVKTQMGFGWDFAPAMRTMGIWDDVAVRVTGPVILREVFTRPVLEPGGRARFRLTLTADAQSATATRLAVELRGATWDAEPQAYAFDVQLAAGAQVLEFELPVADPRLWYPWDRGQPDLYDLAVTLSVDGAPSDTWRARTGLRDVRMARNPGSPAGTADWTFVVNGAPLFARGANWVPADVFPARVTAEDYRTWLALAREANMNMLRVWGGGLREKHAFYAEADRLGLMVWQEFPHACAFAARFPHSREYLQLAEREARAIVRSLRNHPSVVLWCGGNEFSPRRNAALVAVLHRAAETEDGTRPFNPASPSGGESHNWVVWHQQAPVATYRQDRALFASEFGLQSVPAIESLRRFIPPDQLWPPGAAWRHHCAELPKLAFYARPYLARAAAGDYASEWTRHFASAEEFADATRRAQADGLQVAIEHYRRRKSPCGGCLLWQLNEPWPAISWAIVDYYRVPKAAYECVRRIYNPLLVSLDFPLRAYQPGETLTAAVWLVNDWPRAFPGCRVEVTLGDDPARAWTGSADIPPDSVTRAGDASFVLPARGPGAWALVARVWQGDTLLSENDYTLDPHDPRRPRLLTRAGAWLWHRLTR